MKFIYLISFPSCLTYYAIQELSLYQNYIRNINFVISLTRKDLNFHTIENQNFKRYVQLIDSIEFKCQLIIIFINFDLIYI